MTSSSEWLRLAEGQEQEAKKWDAAAQNAKAHGNRNGQVQYEQAATDARRIAQQNRELARG